MCGGGIKTRLLDCVRSDGKSVDMKFCEEVRPAKRKKKEKETLKCLLLYFPFIFPGQFSPLLSLFDTLVFPNDLITSLITIHYRVLPALLGPQQHEIFRSISHAEIVVVAPG